VFKAALLKDWMRFEVLTVASMKIAVFWVVLYSLAEVCQHFRGVCCLHIIALMMDAVSVCEIFVNFYHSTQHNHPEDVIFSERMELVHVGTLLKL
jgi:hypothetical protein